MWPGGFAEWYRWYRPERAASVTTRFLVWINVLFVVMALIPVVMGFRPYGVAFWLVVASIAAANGLFSPVGGVRTRRYSPESSLDAWYISRSRCSALSISGGRASRICLCCCKRRSLGRHTMFTPRGITAGERSPWRRPEQITQFSGLIRIPPASENRTMNRSLPNVPAVLAVLTAVLVLFAAKATSGASRELSGPVAAPVVDATATSAAEDTAVFAGGCFWGVEAVFEHVKGVKSAVSGYAGGNVASPSYEQVSSGDTGHAESVQVIYDPAQVSYGKLLQIFFSVAHDPTQLNRQGPDRGTQYRSEIFYNSPQQQQVAESYIKQLTAAKTFSRPIVTKVEKLNGFFRAEEYHQDYLVHHPNQPYIVINDAPKVAALKKQFPDIYRN